ncbi:hypothetical protein AKJ09_04175 [Labilithrix luteola]|uniref:Uncharacterized protein n=1 Tax=Labilithrix luteola TaxID=1391654 RepID=A0A0K1PVU7_9BACT|nr:hypothetical protein [Labilithrix luteola]AKU97511.1 hypothetical protein AKJ09_04175 [Labilithrix luteola]
MSFDVHQEPDRIPPRPVLLVALGSMVVLLGSLFVVEVLLRADSRGRDVGPPFPAVAPPTIGKVDRTLLSVTERGITERNTQREQLSHYRWVDRDAGIAGIPIEQAMDMLVQHPPEDR